MSIEAMKLALEVLEDLPSVGGFAALLKTDRAIEALRAAIQQAEGKTDDSVSLPIAGYSNARGQEEALVYLRDAHSAIKHAARQAPSVPAGRVLDCYDAGILNDFGGGNVEWWQDYIRAELGHAHDFYQSQIDAANTPPQQPKEPS